MKVNASCMSFDQLKYNKYALVSRHWSAGELYELNKDGKLIFNTEYQRSEVWTTPKKQLLIDSILRKYDISMIFLRQIDGGIFECLDGQQRLRTIFEFLENKFPIHPSVTKEAEVKTTFGELPDNLKSRVREFIIHSSILYNANDEITSDIFLRLQDGMTLNTAEKLNAISGFMRKRSIDLSKHDFFKNLGVSDTRFGHRFLVSQMIILTTMGNFKSLKFEFMKQQFRQYKDKDIPVAKFERVKRVLNLLNSSILDKSIIRNRADVLSLYTMTDAIREEYSTTGIEEHLGQFVTDFLEKVEKYKGSGQTIENEPYSRYYTLRSSSSDSGKNIQERHNIILSKFLEFKPDLLPKDPKRLFTYGERLALYHRANGKCELCGKDTPFDQGQADHKKRHTDGGLTTIDNGRWLCEVCNTSLGNIPSS